MSQFVRPPRRPAPAAASAPRTVPTLHPADVPVPLRRALEVRQRRAAGASLAALALAFGLHPQSVAYLTLGVVVDARRAA